jgi:hypothetical protein
MYKKTQKQQQQQNTRLIFSTSKQMTNKQTKYEVQE